MVTWRINGGTAVLNTLQALYILALGWREALFSLKKEMCKYCSA